MHDETVEVCPKQCPAREHSPDSCTNCWASSVVDSVLTLARFGLDSCSFKVPPKSRGGVIPGKQKVVSALKCSAKFEDSNGSPGRVLFPLPDSTTRVRTLLPYRRSEGACLHLTCAPTSPFTEQFNIDLELRINS